MIKLAVCAFAVLMLMACGAKSTGAGHPSGRRDPNLTLIPAGTSWSCANDHKSAVHSCFRGEEACKASLNGGEGECAEAKTASCMTYYYTSKSKNDWNCFDDKTMCEKFLTFLSNQKGPTAAREISYCVDR